MTIILGYLLVGFVLHWIGAQVWKVTANESTAWELAATVLWPITVLVVGGVMVVDFTGMVREQSALKDHMRERKMRVVKIEEPF